MAIALDIETTGLNPWEDEIAAIGLSIDGAETVTYTPWDDGWAEIPFILSRLFKEGHEVIAHNAAFDIVWLKVQMDIDIPENIWDTMIAEALLTAGYAHSVSLSEVVLRRFEEIMDKELQTSFTLDEKPSEEQLEYLRKDVNRLFDIRNQQEEEIIDDDLEEVWYGIEKPVTQVFCSMIYEGISLNVEELDKLISRERSIMENAMKEVATTLSPHILKERIAVFDDRMAKWKAYNETVSRLEEEHYEMWKYLVDADPSERPEWEQLWGNKDMGSPREKGANLYIRHKMSKWKKMNKKPAKPKLDRGSINLGSPQQVKAAFLEMGVPLKNTREETLKMAAPSASEEVRSLIITFLKYKKSAKLVNAFGESLTRFLDADNRLHSSLRQYGTETGRPTASEPNVLQIPNTPEFRDCFVAEDGYVMVICDYSQMELREMAQLSGDRNMTAAFREGLDLHQNTAALMYNIPYEKVTDSQRKIAKTVNFGTLYGMGPDKLAATMAADGVHMTLEDAKDALNRWKNAYSGAARAIQQWGNDALENGYTITAMGRKRRFRVIPNMDRGELGRIRRQGANHVIQGTNADITKLAMVLIHSRLKAIGGSIRLQVYDEIVATVPKEHAEEGAIIVKSCMLAAAEEVLTDVPAVVDCVISTSWSEKSAI